MNPTSNKTVDGLITTVVVIGSVLLTIVILEPLVRAVALGGGGWWWRRRKTIKGKPIADCRFEGSRSVRLARGNVRVWTSAHRRFLLDSQQGEGTVQDDGEEQTLQSRGARRGDGGAQGENGSVGGSAKSLQKETVVLVHGYAGTCDAFLDPKRSDLCGALMRAGFDVVTFDLYGHGYSDAPEISPFSAELFTEQLTELMMSLPELMSVDAIHIVAHSMGSAPAALFANLHGHRVKSLVFLSPSLAETPLPWHLSLALRIPIFREIIAALIIPTFGEGTNSGNAGLVRACLGLIQTRLEFGGSWFASSPVKELDLVEDLYERDVKMLFLWGEGDQAVHYDHATRTALGSRLGPRALVATHPTADHMDFADGDAATKAFFLSKTLDFLSSGTIQGAHPHGFYHDEAPLLHADDSVVGDEEEPLASYAPLSSD